MKEASVYAYWLYSINGVGSRAIWLLRNVWFREKDKKADEEKEINEIKEANEIKETNEIKEINEIKEANEVEETKGIKETKEIQESDFARAIYFMEEDSLKELCCSAWGENGRSEKKIEHILQGRKEAQILKKREKELQEFSKRGISFYSMEDSAYPKRLREIPDPPYGLFVKGRLPDPARPCVAIIGARMASAYGREQARRFAKELAENGIQIVSGMARGIDGIAERAAFDGGGVSFAVLGSGVDVCYPRENQNLYDRTVKEGGVISEYFPGMQPLAQFFPARNRIISGLAEVLLVVEARAHSGTLITVDMALEQGKEVFAIPGRVSDALSFGCNRLIRQGAGIAMEPRDILEYFYGISKEEIEEAQRVGEKQGIGREKETGEEQKIGEKQIRERYSVEHTFSKLPLYQKREVFPLSEMEKLLYDLLEPLDAQNLDDITQAAEERLGRRVEIPEVTQGIMQLILYGMAKEDGMGRYRREAD